MTMDEIEEKIQGMVLGWELIVVRLIGKTGLLGIDGGFDSSRPSQPKVSYREALHFHTLIKDAIF